MNFSWLYSQLISAQNQWIAALNEVNTHRGEFVAGKILDRIYDLPKE